MIFFYYKGGMNDEYDDIEVGGEIKSKRKHHKKGSNVPLSELGFKSKVFYDTNSIIRRRRKPAKYSGKQQIQNRKECFMAQLTFLVDATQISHEQAQNFKGIKKSEWEKVKQVVYRTRDQIYCCICLQRELTAPQMTCCGHIFCWNCIYMHQFKSFKASNCPICNDVYSIQELRSCKPIHQKSLKQCSQGNIQFTLKTKRQNQNKIYDPIQFEQDFNFCRIVKATKSKIKQIFEKQQSQLLNLFQKTQEQQTKNWISRVLSLSEHKIAHLNSQINHHYKLHKSQKNKDSCILHVLQQKDRIGLVNFYQQSTGKLVYLHPICQKYIRREFPEDKLPLHIDQQILLWEETEYSLQMAKRCKNINHLLINQEIDLVIINLKRIIGKQLLNEFQKEFETYQIHKQDALKSQERQSQRLKLQYQTQKQYLRKLKKMEESEFYDIRVPTTIDISEINSSTLFPSLINKTNSYQEEVEVPKVQKKQLSEAVKISQKKIIMDHDDFPQLGRPKEKEKEKISNIKYKQIEKQMSFQIENVKNMPIVEEFPDLARVISKKKEETQSQLPQKKIKGKKKKEKFIDVTEQFFQRQSQDNDSNY